MNSKTHLRSSGHAVYALHTHMVFVTKYRRAVFTKEIIDELRVIFARVCKAMGAQLSEFDGEEDHVHLLIEYPPKVAISQLANHLKCVSSREIRLAEYITIKRKLWGDALWSPSYFAASCGGAPIAIIRQYIEQQNTPD
jgi:putative transposase